MKSNLQIEKEFLGETLSKYQEIALSLNSFPLDTLVSIDDLANKANVHWNTAKKALLFFYLSAPIMPDFIVEPDFRFKIIRKSKAINAINVIFESYEMKIVIKMMLKGMTSKDKGRTLKELKKYLEKEEIDNIHSILEQGYINSEEGIFYLSTKGKLLANRGIKKISDLGIPLPWEEQEEEIKPSLYKTRNLSPINFEIFTGDLIKSEWSPYKIIKR